MTAAKVCVGCLRIFAGLASSRCAACQQARARAEGPRPYDAAGYRRERDRLVAAAEADPTVTCWLCRSRLPPPGYAAGWNADHFRGRLIAAHAGCNSARGDKSPEWFTAHLRALFPGWVRARGNIRSGPVVVEGAKDADS